VDHGLYRKLDPLFIKDYARFWISIIRGDERMIDRYAYQIFTHNRKPDHGTIKHHRLFASMVSGRSWSAISNKNGGNGIMARRAQTEVESVQANASDSRFFEAITIVLSKCPRELLLIIKTNDLIRSIDERLSGSSPSQMKDIMLLLAWYCKSVYQYKNYDSDRSEFQNFINDSKLTLVLVFARLWPIT
jgi:aarF domain-containing kinase